MECSRLPDRALDLHQQAGVRNRWRQRRLSRTSARDRGSEPRHGTRPGKARRDFGRREGYASVRLTRRLVSKAKSLSGKAAIAIEIVCNQFPGSSRGWRRAYLTSKTGTSAECITLVATDPRSMPETDPRPRVPITICCNFFSLMYRATVSPTSPTPIW